MAPQKGKQGTRGAKQIVHENEDTVTFYRTMSLTATVFQSAVMAVMFNDSLTMPTLSLIVLSSLIHLICYKFFTYTSRATYSESGQLLDSGVDLNMEGGISEHVKDLVILTSGTQMLTLLSEYFWFLLLLIPIRAGQMLWKTVLGPWFFQEGPQEPEVNDKKQKKMERKKMRQN